MLGSIKAALAAAATSIKSALPTVVAATTATVLTGGCIYYYTVKDGMYEKNSSNVRYVLEEYISQITIDSIVKKEGDKGYTYTENFEGLVDNIINELEKAESNIAEYTGKDNKENIIKKLIKAEIITQYPDLRSESEIRNKVKVDENELQGGIKIIRKDSKKDNSELETNDLNYEISNEDQILTYIPYEEFENKKENNDETLKKYFSLKKADDETSTLDLVVAGWTEETTTIEKVEYIPKEEGKEEKVIYDSEKEKGATTFEEISINYQNMLSKYSMPAGFLWSLLVMGESTTFVEDLADLAINNTEIIIEAQDSISTTVNTDIQKYKCKRDITKTVVTEDGTTKAENVVVTAQTDSSITTTVETKQSNTSLNLAYAETWLATYKTDYKNTVYEDIEITDEWQKDAEWKELEDVNLGETTEVSDSANNDDNYEDIKNKIINEITTEKCEQILISKLQSLTEINSLYYVFNWDVDNENKIYNKSVEYMYNYIKSGFIEEFINNITIKNEMSGHITSFWDNKSEEVEKIYLDNDIEKTDITDKLYKMLNETANSMITLSSAETKVNAYKVENKSTSNLQTNNTNIYTSAGTNVQERVDIDKDDNFIAYFNKSGRAKEYILDSPEWLYEMLESHEKTANIVDLFRYLLYEATNNDYGITSYDFTPYTNLNSAIQTALQQYISFMHAWEGQPPEEGDYYTVFDDGYGNLTIGWGVCFYSKIDGYMRKQDFADIGYDVTTLKVGDKIEKDLIDNIENKEIQEKIERVDAITSGFNLTQYQKYALVDRMYQAGNIVGFVDAYNSYWKETDDLFGENTSSEDYSHELAKWFIGNTTGGVANRRKAQWLVFKYGYYNRIDEYYSGGTYNSEFYYGIAIYNIDGSVSQMGIEQLDTYLTQNVLRTTKHIGNSQNQNGPFEKWWSRPYNYLSKFQCTWWANGRASQYLEITGSKYTSYPTQGGNGGEYYKINRENGWFNYGSTPKPNSIISWSSGEYGHVGFVEAVDTNGDIYVSEAGSGTTWHGIRKYSKSNNYAFAGTSCNGFVYLDEPK